MKLNSILEKKGYHFDTGKSGEEGSEAEKQFNQHHASSMYGAHMGYPADKDTIDFDDSMQHQPGVQKYKLSKDKKKVGYEPIEDVEEVWVRNKKTGKEYDVKKPNPSKHEFAWDYRGSKENPNPFKKGDIKKESLTIKESFDVVDALILALIQGGVGLSIGALGSYMISGSLVTKLKSWWNSNKGNSDVKRVVTKLKSDSDVKKAMKNPKDMDVKSIIKKKVSSSDMNTLKGLNEDVNVNDNDKNEMLSGIAQILSGVEDMSNRKELAKQQIIQLKDEGIEFDIKEFLQMCGFGSSDKAGIENQSLTSEMSNNDIHFKGLLKIYSRGGNLKKAISNYLYPGKAVQPQSTIAKDLRSMNYDEVTELEKRLRIDIHKY